MGHIKVHQLLKFIFLCIYHKVGASAAFHLSYLLGLGRAVRCRFRKGVQGGELLLNDRVIRARLNRGFLGFR